MHVQVKNTARNVLRQAFPALAQELAPEVRQWREHLHRHPELSFHEHRTAAFIRQRLRAWGIPYDEVADTGTVGFIRGQETEKWIALRADIDALPIAEQNEVPYRSENDGVMHACGHDVHTALLLGAARMLQQVREALPYSVKLIFQPAEEKSPGGASLMVREGVLEGVAVIYGQHVAPDLPVGTAGFCPGPFMASTDELHITLRGKGGHAAIPHETVNPIRVGAHLISAVQTRLSFEASPFDPVVLNFGRFAGGHAVNVVPDAVELLGTLRTFNEPLRNRIKRWLRDEVPPWVRFWGATAEVRVVDGYPPLVNDPDATERLRRQVAEVLGEENVRTIPPRMTAEDFAFYVQEVPGCFFRIGVRAPDWPRIRQVHTATFDVHPDVFYYGLMTMAAAAFATPRD